MPKRGVTAQTIQTFTNCEPFEIIKMFKKHDKVVEKTRRHHFDNLFETFVWFGNYPRIARKRRILPK